MMKKRALSILMTLAIVLALCPVADAAGSSSIPSDAAEFQDHYYKIYPDRKSWQDARDECARLGGHLATITSAEEQAFIESLNADDRSLWIGGYRDDEMNWYWVTGEAWDHDNWGSGEPNNQGNERYAAVWPKFWNDLRNDSWEQSGYICEWDDASSSQGNSSDGRTVFQGHYYQVIEPGSGITWEDAKQYCEQLGGYLATVTSEEEQAFVDSLIGNSSKNGLWLGAYRRQSDREFVWVTGEPFGYTNWSAYQPDDTSRLEDKLMLYTYHNKQYGKWNDLTNEGWSDVPSSKMGLICEWDSASSLPSLGGSSIQNEVVRKDGQEGPDWVDRLKLPEYAEELYDTISGGEDGEGGVFETEGNFALPQSSTGAEVSQVERINVVEFSLMDLYASPGAELNSAIFSNESFYTIPSDSEDNKIDYTGLNMGDVVTTPNFNGVYVTKIPYDNAFDSKKKDTCEYIAAVYHAFDRDHPEIFWLSGSCKLRIMVASEPNGTKDAYFFLVLADKDGFTMCAPAWTRSGSITAGMARRDAAVAAILKTVTASTTVDRVKQLNKWLTEHNQYNTTADLTSISNEPHECLAALVGSIGTDGPVCDGYSRAFKVLCDKLGIPCILETGWARTRVNSTAEFHMWDLVQVGKTWYGADITWDDPTPAGSVGAKSGRENENYLLVGADTVINGLTFRQSHVVKNQAAVGGVDFNNGPVLSPIAYSGLSLPSFTDVSPNAYYYDSVLWAVDRGITVGTSATTFSPNKICTQVQILTFLWRAAGEPSSTVQLPFALNSGLNYAKDALRWAYQKGMIDASFDQTSQCTRSITVKFIWQALGAPSSSATGRFTDVPAGADYAQAVAWAVAKGVTAGTSATTFTPGNAVTRKEAVTFLYRAYEK